TITPWTVDENDDNACAGTSIDIDVWVDPTAKVSLDPEKDTICTSLNSSITISSVTESLHPLRFYYEALYPVPDVEVFYRQDTSNLIKGSVIADSIVNHSSVPQKVAFVVSPYLMDAYGERKCYGISDTSHIWVAPTLRVEVDTISTYIGGNNIRCFGQNNGSIYLRPTGGITAFDEYNIFDLTYEWSNGRTTKDISGLPAGSYSVIINDKFNCIDDSTFVLTQPQKLISEIIVIDTLSCHGADGTIAPLTTGGMQGYNYTWTPPIDYHLDPPVHTDTLFNVIEGYYILQVIDTNNCAYTTAFDVSQPLPVYVGYVTELYGDYEIRCHGENSGRMITFNNSLSMLTYEWTGPNGFDTTFTTNERFIYYEDLYAGQYSLFYTDAAGCSGSKTVNLYEPDSLVINDYTISEYHDRYNVSCYGSGDGSISLNEITGGHDYAGYSYAWTVESGSGTVDPVSRNQVNLSAGTYAVKVNDSFNCSATDTFELKEPDRIEINTDLSESVNGMYNLNCEGDHDGYIILHVSGGDTIGSNYTYQWRHGPSATELHDLTAGSYTIEVTDGIGCSRTDTIELTEPSALLIDSVALSDYHGYEISCFGLSNGTMLAYPNGGAEEYSYDWYREDTPLSRDTIFIDSLRAGNYSLILTDANNCSTNWSGTLNEPVELSLSVETENANCTYTRLGTAQATVDGGVGPYGYSWDSGQSTAYIANLDTGTYVLTVQDMNACQVIDTVNIEQNVNITLNLQIVQEISCYKGSDGIVMAVASSGVEPYTYLWDDGSTTETISGLSSGTYSVLVTDQDGCSNVDTIPVMDPEKIRADFSATDALCFGSADGTVILDATGGAGNYSYYWNGSLLPDAMVTGLSAGTYVLDISDSKECNVDTVVVIDQPQPIVIHRNDSYTFVPFCPDWANGTLAVHVTGGTPEYEYIWTDFPEEHDSILTDIREDWYSVRVIDEHGCIADATFHIEAINNTCLGIPTAFTPNYDHANDTWDLSYINEDGGDAPFHEVYPNGVIQVYDRWGTLVFRCTGGCPNPWNGEDLKGRELPVDSYYYIIELNEGKDLPPLKGTVTIIR
ncbi:MAG: gliding motility-associated C-terminal domain-containing protein, partial [Bacteroidales bacterium]|nr:gliding motility-associated C-terminal domain-containing protein [Bacteroidales bacterium]